MTNRAIFIGNSDGIGLAFTKEMLQRGWQITGISRSQSPLKDSSYRHIKCEVQDVEFLRTLSSVIKDTGSVDLCIYFTGIGELFNPEDMDSEAKIIEVNLLGMVRTASVIIPTMISQGKGHFIGLSSLADEMLSPEAPSYHASKAGFSNYLESLALALKPHGIFVTNVRFGFVDTKMAKGDFKPFMMSRDRSVSHLLKCLDTKPIRYTAPKIAIPLVKFRRYMLRLYTIFK